MVMNDLIDFSFTVNVIKLKDEWDVEEMKKIHQKYDRTMVTGTLPG